jgi:hypothetical protein
MLGSSNLTNRVLRARFAACLSALWVVFGAQLAHAITLVPMCGLHAETQIAPPISRPSMNGVIRSGACEDVPLLELHKGLPDRSPEHGAPPQDAPRVPPVYFRLPPVPCTRAPIVSVRADDRSGFRSGIERPPR